MEPESWWSVTLLRRAHQWTGTLVMDTFAFAMAASLGALAVVPGFKWEAEELTLTMRQTLTQVATKDGVVDLRTFFVELEKEVTQKSNKPEQLEFLGKLNDLAACVQQLGPRLEDALTTGSVEQRMQSLLEGARDCASAAIQGLSKVVDSQAASVLAGLPDLVVATRGIWQESIRRTAGGEHPGNGHQIRPVHPLPAVSGCKMGADAGRRRARRRRRAPCRHLPEYFQHRGDPCLSDGNRRASDTRIRRHRSHDGLNLREPGREAIRCPGRWNVQQLGRVSHPTRSCPTLLPHVVELGNHTERHPAGCVVGATDRKGVQFRCSVPLFSSAVQFH